MNEANPKNPKQTHIGLKLTFLGIAAAGLLGGMLLQATAPDPEALAPAAAQAPLVDTYRLEVVPFQPRTTIIGLLEPRREVEIFAETRGRVIEIGADEFDAVAQEQLLVRMKPLLAKVAVNRAEAAIARAKSQGILARATLERAQGLAKVDVSSRSVLDEAENAARQARAARLEAEAALAEAKDRLGKATIKAPFAGVLRNFNVEVGEYLQPGEPIAELLDVSALRVRISLTDRQIVSVLPGTPASLEVDARPGEAFSGRVISVSGAADPLSRKFQLLVEVDNRAGRLLPGMVTRVDLTLGETRDVMTLPLDSVLDQFGLRYAFVIVGNPESDWEVVKRRIDTRPIPFRPTELEVVAGLAEGELVAVSSIRQLQDGMIVQPFAYDSDGAHAIGKNDP
ncbi:MAG TPA: efflux RND transporter periplasmic adaptor subunit [Myxococcales bacterium]|nr:efflux RND transporter periplasmic adaptor subunit [Myxococcales bacterium]